MYDNIIIDAMKENRELIKKNTRVLRFTFVCLVSRGLSEETTFRGDMKDKGKPWLKTQWWEEGVCLRMEVRTA